MWVSQEHIEALILKKSKCISSPEQNYFSRFAMRYPVLALTLILDVLHFLKVHFLKTRYFKNGTDVLTDFFSDFRLVCKILRAF